MNFEDLIELYKQYKNTYGQNIYKHISALLNEAKETHKQHWLQNPTPKGDHEQSWRSFKGKNFEKLIHYMIKDEVEDLGLKIIEGNKLENLSNLPEELSIVKRNLVVNFGEFGMHLPDVDLIIYNPANLKVIAVLSVKITLRERIAQTGYWKIKLSQDVVTKDIKVYFITPDEDGTLTLKYPAKKGRAIVEVELDGSYVLNDQALEESDKVKFFHHFIEDLKSLINNE